MFRGNRAQKRGASAGSAKFCHTLKGTMDKIAINDPVNSLPAKSKIRAVVTPAGTPAHECHLALPEKGGRET
jgi:hypothetical protein